MKAIKNMTAAELRAELASLEREFLIVGREIIRNGETLLAAHATLQQSKFGLPIEIKRGPGASSRIAGYASVFNVVDHGRDVVMPGAFAETLAKHRRDGTAPVMLWSHNMDEPIGVWEKFAEDAKGLHVEGRLLPSVRRGAEAIELIDAGATSGLSIGYRTLETEADPVRADVRRLVKVQLFEVSVVSIPMNSQARLSGKELGIADLRRAFESLAQTARSLGTS